MNDFFITKEIIETLKSLEDIEIAIELTNNFNMIANEAKSIIEEKLIERIKEDKDITLSDIHKKILQNLNIDFNELVRRVKEKADEKKEQLEEQEALEMAVAKKEIRRLRLIHK